MPRTRVARRSQRRHVRSACIAAWLACFVVVESSLVDRRLASHPPSSSRRSRRLARRVGVARGSGARRGSGIRVSASARARPGPRPRCARPRSPRRAPLPRPQPLGFGVLDVFAGLALEQRAVLVVELGELAQAWADPSGCFMPKNSRKYGAGAVEQRPAGLVLAAEHLDQLALEQHLSAEPLSTPRTSSISGRVIGWR